MDDVEVENDSAAMAAMMGFSGFGNQNALSKKRKFNTATDAFVEGVELEKIDRGGRKGQGSGGNQIPLGRMRVMGVKTMENRNDEEIDLGDDEDGDGNGEDEGPRYLDTSAPPPIFDGIEGGEHSLGQDGQSEDPAIVEERRKAQEQIDAILAAAPEPASTNISQPASGLPHGLPEKPVYSNLGFKASARSNRGGRSGGSDAGSMASSRPSGRGTFNEKWYEGYYDKSFNKNPWAKLEQKMGLEAKGSWV
ncbi:predicted protein [Sclerotinia sclerotiorum 1980 UF-70]|uniref:Uncharacterized protein n=2 Tax=Sclerotinia sclerotiorum (strain ATCC 18683 / 1980 / Ss-1) TaxID=665079 RepID=A7F2S4_SCLS1|nr:predicted protein [Sclerotinia sclerotiorum 1980 UF-70]APA09421.1 hypothetical protein sscle_05g041910 [Sclerotinia sclerotiorum 1980 UF-70]EDN96016.1 predicted protein [Sclerotinia sclerotiorum 1980 UF-70]